MENLGDEKTGLLVIINGFYAILPFTEIRSSTRLEKYKGIRELLADSERVNIS